MICYVSAHIKVMAGTGQRRQIPQQGAHRLGWKVGAGWPREENGLRVRQTRVRNPPLTLNKAGSSQTFLHL